MTKKIDTSLVDLSRSMQFLWQWSVYLKGTSLFMYPWCFQLVTPKHRSGRHCMWWRVGSKRVNFCFIDNFGHVHAGDLLIPIELLKLLFLFEGMHYLFIVEDPHATSRQNISLICLFFVMFREIYFHTYIHSIYLPFLRLI